MEIIKVWQEVFEKLPEQSQNQFLMLKKLKDKGQQV